MYRRRRISSASRSTARQTADPSESVGRSRKKIALEEQRAPCSDLAKSAALIRPAKQRRVGADRSEIAARLESQREVLRQRSSRTQRKRHGKSCIDASGSKSRAQAGCSQSAAKIGLQPLIVGKRHGSPNMQIFHDGVDGSEPVAAQVRGLPAIKQLVL